MYLRHNLMSLGYQYTCLCYWWSPQ